MADLLIVTDATASMGGYLHALRASIPEILALAKLSGAFSRLGVLAYRDYSDPLEDLVAWSGWNAPNLTEFVRDLSASGGGDFPEAAKTALIRGLQAVNKESKTLVLWYADAPPHHPSIRSYQNDVTEVKAFPAGAVDWVKLCHTARRRNCTVFSFVPSSMESEYSAFYILLSELTSGICIASTTDDSTLISRLTLGVVMQWMGYATSGMDEVILASSASLLRYQDESPLTATPKLSDELDGSRGYLPPSLSASPDSMALRALNKTRLQSTDIPLTVQTSKFDPGKRFAAPAETEYRDSVYESLTSIIQTNVASLTYNPIFGILWRAVCKDPDPRKAALTDLFSEYVGRIAVDEKKAAMRSWLEESFDQTDEIERIIASQTANGPVQMVYLDFDADVQLTRPELLEVSRSCYPGVLKKVARLFTHLKLVEPGITLAPSQRSIPLALPARDFYRILPHLIVPGTLYPWRAATLTALVALLTGVPFLKDSATALVATAKGKWLDLEVPENISFDCARFLLSAPTGVVLTKQERTVYQAMQRYKLIELNLDAPVDVRVPWTPDKTRGPGDLKVQCRRCLIRRSVTIMSHEHSDLCGICVPGDLSVETVRATFPGVDEAETCWVECSTKECRAQYVVENVAGLRIRPRCHYCRNHIPCPWIECTVCTNRVIVPRAFRTTAPFTCPSCTNPSWAGRCIAVEETTTRVLNAQNGLEWLGFSAAHTEDIFKGKSAFKLMQAHGAGVFGGIPADKAPRLLLGGKTVKASGQTLGEIEERVGRGEVVHGTCSLCFEEMPHSKLLPACGRTGCTHLVDDACLHEWYGKNAPGNLINMMQLMCPFCRRPPTVKTLARYNRGVAALGGLQAAMADRRWLYAWCVDCASAKRAFERTACTEEGVGRLEGFRCQECETSRRARAAMYEDLPAIDSESSEKPVVACPNKDCEYYIEKTDGCNHVVCVCGTHLCYSCGGEFSPETIYEHMNEVHGSIYA
ncbi:hypothetical protein FB45DRAFT_743151 [Roridomyces roridus]|uniref:RBR-type E3 ubiquitin transferase n=1 Tax=Roridomyces roridus TaxID=1738132 RepID=A0AAD7C011_9AGAR|nr:hypothetical protein FB45DRAFT_743151 [Roridomyces roridus]